MALSVLEADRTRRLLSAVNEGRVEWLFSAGLVVFVGVLLWLTLGYERFARIIPLMIGVPTFALLAVVLLSNSSPRIEAFLDRHQLREVIDIEEDIKGDDSTDEASLSRYEQRLRFLTISAWILGFTLLFVFVGVVESILVFLLGYYRFVTKLSVRRTVGYTVGVELFVFVLFDLFLEMRFFENSVFWFLFP